MALSAGTRLGPYEIVSAIGAGGMGEVYRARDPRIGREVAIKILPPAFSKDQDRLRRFQQEAHSAGVLNHPNILAVYDAGTENGAPYIVSELLDGETLREKLRGGQLSVRKVIDYALQIAHGLAAAHEKGITHRDLKPENLFVMKDGRVKILDFGLAKLTEKIAASQDGSALQTIAAESNPGTVLGTVGYMSPEQVRGLQVDPRSDMFTLGAIIYEMFTGKRAFSGNTQADTISSILQKDPPDLMQSNADAPAAAEKIVRHCLEKDVAQRFQSAHDLAFALEALSGITDPKVSVTRSATTINRHVLWILIAAAVVAIMTITWLSTHRNPTEKNARLLQLSINPPAGITITGWPVISPDATQVVFTANDETGRGSLWLRSLSSSESYQLMGTEDALWPFWSPDSKYVAFFALGKLKKMQLPNGTPQNLSDASDPRGGAWNQAGTILFSPFGDQGLYRVSSAGGNSTPVTQLAKNETSHRWPIFLPNGRDFLFYIFPGAAAADQEGIYHGSLDSTQRQKIGESIVGGIYMPPGYLVFQQNATLMAQAYDLKENQLKADPIELTDKLSGDVDYTGGVGFSASSSAIACIRRDQNSRLIWLDRSGKQIGSVGDPRLYTGVSLSADGKKTAVDIQTNLSVSGHDDLWVQDTETGTSSRMTFGPPSSQPVWSADGTKIFFSSNRNGFWDLYTKNASGGGQDQQLLHTGNQLWPDDCSSDGRFLLYEDVSPKSAGDLWVLSLSGSKSGIPLVNSARRESQGTFSPDVKFVAYASDETGRPEIYVQTFPDASLGRWQISTNGGMMPAWRGDGKELFYLTLDRKLIAVNTSNGFPASSSNVLFTNVPVRTNIFPGIKQYAVPPDGQRFLINAPVEDPSRASITVIYNWQELLKR